MNVTIICKGFDNSSIHLQPWRHIYEVSRLMTAKGIKITILSDRVKSQPASEKVDNIEVLHIDHLMWLPIIKRGKIQDVLRKSKADVIVWCGKPLSCVSLAQLGFVKKPIVWMVESGVHSLRCLLGLSLREMLSRNHIFLWNEILNAIFPHFLIRRIANSLMVKKVIVPSQYLKNSLLRIGVLPTKVTVIQSTLDEYYRRVHSVSKNTSKVSLGFQNEDFIVTYMGSPCTLRGSDTVIRSIPIILANQKTHLKCLILSRRPMKNNSDHLRREEEHLRELVHKLKAKNTVKIVPGILSIEELLQFIQISDVVVLPFKLLQSEMPLSVLEAMALGKVVVTTKIRTLQQIAGGNRGVLIESSNPHSLAKAILDIINGEEDVEKIAMTAKKFAFSLPSWGAIADKTISILEEVAP